MYVVNVKHSKSEKNLYNVAIHKRSSTIDFSVQFSYVDMSVCLSVCNVDEPWSCRLGFFESN